METEMELLIRTHNVHHTHIRIEMTILEVNDQTEHLILPNYHYDTMSECY